MSRASTSSAVPSVSHASNSETPEDASINQDSSGSSVVPAVDEAVPQDSSTPNLSRSSSLIREIYKNSWLKQIPSMDKWSGRMYKSQKPEKFWVVFCVHDDKDAFLEFYENRRSAYSHNPLSSVSLMECLHISPTIVVQDNDHEFVITLETRIVRLAASTREQMVEWMDTLRNKLRDLNVLEPKDNLYSREPIFCPKISPSGSLSESLISLDSQLFEGGSIASSQTDNSLSRVSLRDPTSPLPPVPPIFPNSQNEMLFPVASTSSSTPANLSQSVQTDIITTTSVASTPTTTILNINLAISYENSSVLSESISFLQNGSTCSLASNPPIIIPDTEIYEPLFQMSSNEQNNHTVITGVRNPGYENRPESVPVLPPKVNSELRRHSSSSMLLSTTGARLLQNSRTPASNVSSERSQIVRTPLVEAQLGTSSNDRDSSARSSHHCDEEVALSSSAPSHSRDSLCSDATPQTDENGRILSLREAQVLKLQSEILHKSGVRLVLRKKDCINAIAFVECFGFVWVAGWKQKEHPLLHNTFHIGDRIFSISGHKVHNVQEALKIIKVQHIIVEFVICRTPLAKVLAIKKEYCGQDLGLVRDGGTAEIKEVKAGGLALRYGLTPKAPSVDGSGTCNWCLTEINHRPLNLFFKDNEIHDRLNAVGLDISILVQPTDLVKAMKKQLKTIRSYKEYTLQ